MSIATADRKPALLWGMNKIISMEPVGSKYVATTKIYYNYGTYRSKSALVDFECDKFGKFSASLNINGNRKSIVRNTDVNINHRALSKQDIIDGIDLSFNTIFNISIYALIKECEANNDGFAFINNISNTDNYRSYLDECKKFIENSK